MPVYEVQTDSGTYQIEAANEQALSAAVGELPKAQGASLSGIAKSAGAGLVEGVAGLAGLPADALDLVARGADALLGTKAAQESGPIAQKFGSQAMQKRVEGMTGPLYKSQGGIEDFARTAGSFLPGMVGGAASIPVKLGTRVALPAAAAEGAKALTEGTALEPYAPVAAGLTGLAGGLGIERALTRGGVAARPTRDAIEARTKSLYGSKELDEVLVNPNPTSKFIDDLQTRIERDIASTDDAKGTLNLLNRLKGAPEPQPSPAARLQAEMNWETLPQPKPRAPLRIEDFDRVIKRLGDEAGEVNANHKPTPNARAAMESRKALMDYLSNLQQPQLLAGDAQRASAILREAKATAQQGFKMDKIARWLRDAEIDAASTHSGGNLENVIYQKVRTALKNPEKHLRGWSADERRALERVLPNLAESVLRRTGKLLGGGGGLGQLISGGAGGAMFGWPGMAALPAAGMAANRAGSALASRRINNLSDVIASNAPMYAQNRQAFQQSLNGPGLLGSLPSPSQGSLYAALMAQRPQPVQ